MNKRPVRTVLLVVVAVVALAFGIAAGLRVTGCWHAAVSKRPALPPPADVKNPKTLDRDGFTLQYPGNWTIDTADPDYNPDRNFTITSEGGSQISFLLFDSPGARRRPRWTSWSVRAPAGQHEERDAPRSSPGGAGTRGAAPR